MRRADLSAPARGRLKWLASSTLAATLSATALGGPELKLKVQDDCVKPTDLIVVELRMRDLNPGGPAAAGYQAFVKFNPSELTFVNGQYTQSPFGLPVAQPILANQAGVVTLAAGIDVFGGQAPTHGDAVLATLRFAAKGADCNVEVDFCEVGCQTNIITNINAQPLPNLSLDGTGEISIDGTAPRINACCPNQTLSASALCKQNVPDLRGCIQASDNCAAANELIVTQFPAVGTPIGLGTTWVTAIVTDCAGNSAMCQTSVMVKDTTAPTITSCPPDRTLKADNSCTSRVPNLLGQVSATDNCDNPTLLTISQNPPANAVIGMGAHKVTISISDNFGNTATCSVDLNVIDAQAPKIAVCPNDLDLTAGPTCQSKLPDFTTNIVAVDNCTLRPLLTITQNPAPGSAVSLGDSKVTITVTDQAGLSDTCSIDVRVRDLTPPAIQSCSAPAALSLDQNCRAALPDLRNLVIASDTCGNVTVTQSKPAGSSILGAGTLNITMTITDQSGNTANCTIPVTTVDKMPPVIAQCSNNVKIPGDEDCQGFVPQLTGGVVAIDNCPGQIQITQNPAAGSKINKGITPVTITARDASGNASTCTANVIIADETDPILTCPENITAECTGPGGAVVEFRDDISATDNCGTAAINCFLLNEAGQIVGIVNPQGQNYPNKERTFVLCRATDQQGNFSNCIFSITVDDTTAPKIIECPKLPPLAADGDCEAEVPDLRGMVNAKDLCDANIVISQSPPAGTRLNGVGQYLITMTATDNRGNSDSCKVEVDVVDATAPEFKQCSGGFAMKVNDRCLAQLPDLRGGALVNDNCSVDLTITQNPAPSTELGLGSHAVVLTATDAAGNFSTCTVKVDVVDQTAPKIFTCAEDQTLEVAAGCVAGVPELEVLAFDNCDDPEDLEITQDPGAGSELELGEHTILVTVTDSSGNSDTCEVVLNVEDNQAPKLVCPGNRSGTAGQTMCSATVDIGAAQATDNCDVEKISARRSDGLPLDAPFALGNTTITWTAVDEFGNEASCTQTVTVSDANAPLLSCPANKNLTSEAGLCSRQVDPGLASARDNCDGNLTMTAQRSDGLDLDDPFPSGTTTITWRAIDDAGNQSQCAQFINVSPMNTLVVDIDLAANMAPGQIKRCITFELTDCDGQPVEVKSNVTFVNGSAANVQIQVPCGEYTCITAVDRLHTLRRTDFNLSINPGGGYEADFTGPRRLISGNLNGDDIVDILDWAIFAGQFLGVFPGGGDTLCNGPFDPQGNPHADVSGNGFVFVEDHTFISASFRAVSDPDCCSPQGGLAGASGTGTFRISVEELSRAGLGHLTSADLNGDGFVDELDMQAFDQGIQPQASRTFAGQDGGTWFDSASWQGSLLPTEATDVIVPLNVIVDRPGAIARNVRVLSGGGLTLTAGSLAAGSITVDAGATLRVQDTAALLHVTSLTLHEGAQLDWSAGTIVIDGGSFTSSTTLFVGEEAPALLEVRSGGRLVTPHVVIGSLGEAMIDGVVEGDLTNHGLLMPEFLTVDGRFEQSTTGTLEVEIGGQLAALGQDVFVVLGEAALAGTLAVPAVDGFTPHAVESYEVILAGAVTGRFERLDRPAAGDALRFRVVYGEDRVTFEVARAPRRSENTLGSR